MSREEQHILRINAASKGERLVASPAQVVCDIAWPC